MRSVYKKIALFAFACLAYSYSYAQPGTPPGTPVNPDPSVNGGTADIVSEYWKPSLVKDGVIDREEHNNYVRPWQPIREADVLWKKRVWREIDARQKQNLAMRYPGDEYSGGGMYIEILMDAIKKGKITAYADDRFSSPLSVEDVLQKVTGTNDTIPVELANGEIEYRIITKSFNLDNVTKFRVKEDWIFDKNVGRMQVRIIGIAPYLDRLNEDGSFRGSLPMFWLYYPDLRNINARYEVYNPENDIYRITWDDFFEKRIFSSYIIKSTINNNFQEDIMVRKQGVDKLLESERLQEKLFNLEHDLWVY
ncbi:MAG: gliding motility protein GldN [Chitinophagaceae bacterium]